MPCVRLATVKASVFCAQFLYFIMRQCPPSCHTQFHGFRTSTALGTGLSYTFVLQRWTLHKAPLLTLLPRFKRVLARNTHNYRVGPFGKHCRFMKILGTPQIHLQTDVLSSAWTKRSIFSASDKSGILRQVARNLKTKSATFSLPL